MNPEKAAAIQLLDEQLTAAGHDPECAAYEIGKDCSCGVGGHTPTIQLVKPIAMPTGDLETLTGDVAVKLRVYKARAAALKASQQAYEAAGAAYRKALEEFTEAVMK